MRSTEQLICASHCKIYFAGIIQFIPHQNLINYHTHFADGETQPREKNELVQCHRSGKEHSHCLEWESDLEFGWVSYNTLLIG